MALQGISAVFYYGILASITGGYLPVRAKNLWLVVFHLYLFLTFIFFPLVIYLVSDGIISICYSMTSIRTWREVYLQLVVKQIIDY